MVGSSYFDGASGTLIWAVGDSPFLSPGCAVVPQIWTFCSCCEAGREPLHCVCCCSATAGFSAWRFTVTWTTTQAPKLFSFCYFTLPCSLVSSCKRRTHSCWLVSRVPVCPGRALCSQALYDAAITLVIFLNKKPVWVCQIDGF